MKNIVCKAQEKELPGATGPKGTQGPKGQRDRGPQGPKRDQKKPEGDRRDRKSKYFLSAGDTSLTRNMLDPWLVKHMPSWLSYVKLLLGTGVPFHAANLN